MSKPLFSQRLEELLKDKNLKKQDLAKMLGTTPQTISKACNGIRLSLPLARKIITVYPEYDIGWILGWELSPKYIHGREWYKNNG